MRCFTNPSIWLRIAALAAACVPADSGAASACKATATVFVTRPVTPSPDESDRLAWPCSGVTKFAFRVAVVAWLALAITAPLTLL